MCAGTRDRLPRLTAVWWRNRPIRVDDVHRTSAVAVGDGIIDAVRPDGRHTLARATTPASISRRARGTRQSDPREEKKKERILCAFIYGYLRPDELSASETVFSRSCKTRRSVSAGRFRACDERARNRWIDQPFTAGNATFSLAKVYRHDGGSSRVVSKVRSSIGFFARDIMSPNVRLNFYINNFGNVYMYVCKRV